MKLTKNMTELCDLRCVLLGILSFAALRFVAMGFVELR
jgi:hypothetical protein